MKTYPPKRSPRYPLLVALACLALWWPGAFAVPAPQTSPRELVIETSENLVTALQENKDAIKQDMDKAYALAEETVIPHLDFPRITRSVLGKHWRTATDEQRERLTEEFRTLLTRSYVSAMVNYVDQILQHADNVQFPPHRSRQEGESASVTMLISLENGQQAAVQYQMYLTAEGWKIYDVQVEGMSLALTYRSEFSQEITRGGIDALIATLAERNRQATVESLPEVAP